MKFEEKTLSEKVVYSGSYLTMVNIELELPNGKISRKDILKHPGACGIIPITNDGRIMLIKQYRKAIEEAIYEIPAGKLEKGEDPKICAYRELEEETGYKADTLVYLGKIATVPGFCDEYLYLYKAIGLKETQTNFDEDEYIEIEYFTNEEVKGMIKNGMIKDAKTICAYMFLQL